MPIYEYRCDSGHSFEVLQRFSDDPVSTCEACGARVHRVFRPPAVHFKGSGFYNTDYGTRKRAREKESEGAKDGAAKDTKPDSSSSGGESKKASTESKPAKPAKAAAD